MSERKEKAKEMLKDKQLDDVKHYVTGEGKNSAPYYGFLNIEECADITVKNCVFTARKQYSPGTYDMKLTRALNVTFENCTFFLPGGWTETPGCPRTIDKRYPEYDRHGPSAGSKFTVRYAKNFKVINCDIQLAKEDARPEIAYFDYEE